MKNKYIRREKKYNLNKISLLKFLKENYFFFTSSRLINSIYFDTLKEKFHEDGEEGIIPRKKVRIRWYGSGLLSPNNCNLEIKKTLLKEKIKFSQPWKYINKDNKTKEFKNLTTEKNKILDKKLYSKLYICYRRYYFENASQERITYDDKICFNRINFEIKNFQFNIIKRIYSPKCITEIKYKNINSLKQFETEFFPIRYSKYSEGMNVI